MAVVADVNPHARILRVKHRITKVARREIELLPKSGMAMRNVMLAVFAEIPSVCVDNSGRIEIHSRHVLLIDGSDDYHVVLRRNLPHQLDGGSIRYAFGQ